MMKKRTRKLVSVLLTLMMLLSLLPTTALAADSRTVISNVAAKSEGGEIAPKYDTATASPTITVTTGDPAYFYDAYGWQKYNGTKFETYYGNTFTEGTYRYDVQVRIDGESGLTHVLEEDPGLTVTVDDIPWTVENVQVFDNCCWANVHSPEFVVKMPVGQALTFHDSDEFNIGENYVNNPITPYSVADNAKGGTAPYTFSKVSGPAWISVSPEGDISGTPTAAGSNENLVVKVTDSVGAEKTITIAVADTKVDPDDRAKVSAFAATTPGGDITPVCGAPTADNPVFTVTAGSPAYCSTIMCGWRKYDGERYVDCEDTFAADTYYYYMQVRIDGASGTTHMLDDTNLRVTVDGTEWIVQSVHVFDDVSWANVYSPAFVVTEGSAPQKTPITSIHITGITAPEDGSSPYTGLDEITTDTPGLEITSAYWYRDSSLQNYPFEAGYTYNLTIHFEVAEGYEFSDSVTVDHDLPDGTFSGKNLTIDTPWISIDYTVPDPSSKTPIESVTVSGVTEPSVDATPDFDITLTGAGAGLDADEEYDAIVWHKYDPETASWDDMDASSRFGAGTYILEVLLKAEAGYEFTEDTKFYFGEKELPAYNGRDESNYDLYEDGEFVSIWLYFTLEETATPATYTVSFNANGGTGTMEDATGISGEYTLPANGFTAPDGKQFKGWAISPDGAVMSDDSITVSSDITLHAIWEPIPTAPTATIVVKKWDSNQQPLAGATFTLTVPGSIEPAYTAVSGADGLVTFTGVADGSYTLAESEAPAGYIKSVDTWNFVVRGGVVSDVTGTPYDNNNPITVINEIIPAPQTATIVVMKWDSNKQPLAGATFTLTVPGSIEPAYTAVSGADGLVTFTGVADGSYTLAESEAPAGYIKDNATWTFNVRNGVVSDNDGTPYDNSDPLRIANEPALAPELPDIVVWKTDGGQNYIADATFTLTKEREITPAYTATSDENGKVLFEDVADGIYILAESEAPAGYIKTDVTYKFLVENGEVSLYEDDDPVAYEDREPITIANLPVPELPDIVVWKTDGGQNYIAGATFTLTKERETSAAYTATSDENGKVLFEGVADGIYILAETAAPEGYIPTDLIYKFIVEDGTVYLDENDDPMVYEGRLSIVNEPFVTITLPITKVVAKGGTSTPGQQTFTFEIKEFGNSNFDVSAATILENTITTNGVGSFEGVLKFTLAARDADDILSEGIVIAEKNDGATNWTYDTKEWTVYANNAATSGEQWSFLNDDIAPNGAERATFTNTYTKNDSSGGGGGGSSSGGSGSSGGSSGSSSSSNKPVLNKEDHMAFLQGYADGTFRPEKNMTRAQVTVMFARLLVEKMEVGKTYSNSFSDVPADYWAANEIGYMEKFGIINGFNDGTFRPNDPVTRAQFAAIACRFEELTEGTKTFSDVPADHWAAKYISYAAERGWVGGFTDGTFRPNNYITRAQVAAVTCRLLERNADEKYIEKHFDDLTYTFSDMTEQHFAYWYALEASNGHDYTKKADKETWSSLLK